MPGAVFAVKRAYPVLIAILSAAILAEAAEVHTVKAALQTPNSRKAAPVFTLSDANGKSVRLADYRGKVVVLNFWATECGGCRLEIPWFVDLAGVNKDQNTVVVGVSMDVSYESLKDASEAWSKVKPFIRTHGIAYPILMGDEAVSKAYEITALPATYIVDAKGRVAAKYLGLIDEGDVESNVKTLLREGH